MIGNNSYQLNWKLRATIALVLALALSTFPAAFSRTVKAQTPARATASPARESNGGQKEGIRVHGHWTIDVRNPDGTLVTRREFENGLDPFNPLPEILARHLTVGEWEIDLAANVGLSPCTLGTSADQCRIVEPTSAQNNSNVFKTLTVSGPSQTNGNTLVLSGNATATKAGQVEAVRTSLTVCFPNIPAPSCNGSTIVNLSQMTGTTLATPIGVSNGQIVQVTVKISFS